MDPIGEEIIDGIILKVPAFTIAIGNNDMPTICRTTNETLKILEPLLSHIEQSQIQAIASDLIARLSRVSTCMNQGECGIETYISFLTDAVSPIKAGLRSFL